MIEPVKDIPAFIIAGGKSRRFGRDKALYPFEGTPLIERVAGVLSAVFTEITIIAHDSSRFAHLGYPCIPDAVEGQGPLGGIYTALLHSDKPSCFVVACDMPFLDAGFMRFMLTLAGGHDVIVPFVHDYFEALHAIYSSGCREPIREHLETGRAQVVSFFNEVRIRRVLEDEIRPHADPERVFRNINSMDDLPRPGGTPVP